MDQQGQDEGSTGLGFVLGFFLGLIGLIIAYVVIKKPKTQKGSLYGVGALFGLGILCGILNVVIGIASS